MAEKDTTTTASSAPTPEYEKVTSPERILVNLNKLVTSHKQLTITIPGSNDIYNSILVEVAPDRTHLLLDELNVLKGHEQFIDTGKLHAFANLRGVEMSFTSKLLEVVEKDGIPAYWVTYPTELNYRQRRAHYRAPVGHAQAVNVRLDCRGGHVLEGAVSDISVGGLGILIRDHDCLGLSVGEIIPRCTFRLSAEDEIAVQVEVRNHQVRERDQMHLGIRFVDLPRAQVRVIEQFVARLDRELIKKGLIR